MAQEKIVSWPIKKLTVALYIFKIYLKVVYFFIKLFTKQKKQVFFLSRQYNYISFNYKEIIKSLERNNKDIKIKVICQKVNSDINESLRDKNQSSALIKVIMKMKKEAKSMIEYFVSLHKQMRMHCRIKSDYC
jgi:TPP-dependent 2-oxoacid decarboxylase